jgi:putative sterol carrier protein
MQSIMRRIPDRGIERTVGSDLALRLLFTGMAWRYQPERSGGFEGELQYVLDRSGGDPAVWTVVVRDRRARAEQRPAHRPALTVRLAVADMIRVAGGELDLGTALFDGRLRGEGDLALATRLGPMFGAPSPL